MSVVPGEGPHSHRRRSRTHGCGAVPVRGYRPRSCRYEGDDQFLISADSAVLVCTSHRRLMRTACLVDGWRPIPARMVNRVGDPGAAPCLRRFIGSGPAVLLDDEPTVGYPCAARRPGWWRLRPLHAAITELDGGVPDRSRDGVARPESPASARRSLRNHPDREHASDQRRSDGANASLAGAGFDPGQVGAAQPRSVSASASAPGWWSVMKLMVVLSASGATGSGQGPAPRTGWCCAIDR